MELIYTDTSKVEQGILKDYEADMQIGWKKEENVFEVQTTLRPDYILAGSIGYVEGTEYGGIVDAIKIDTAKSRIYYKGRTFRGIMSSKVIQPPSGVSHYVVSGDANEVIGELMEYVGLGDYFQSAEVPCGIYISQYVLPRYKDLHTSLCTMLNKYGAKLALEVKRDNEGAWVEVYAKEIAVWEGAEQIESDHVDFVIEKAGGPVNVVNHIIGLGAGQLEERMVVHRYIQEDGSVGDLPYYTGIDEVEAVYENTNAESLEDLEAESIKALQEASLEDGLSISIEDMEMDLGDYVSAKERITGISAKQMISSKIVKYKDGVKRVSYKIGTEG